jgi:hypothetical protein
MKKYLMLFSVLFCVFFPWFSVADAMKPPSSATIYDTLDRLWSGREFTEVDTYVKQLATSWSNYVPVQLTLAIYSYKYGAQVEDAISRLISLRESLRTDIRASSPVFMDLLDARILRYENSRSFYLEQGITREKRLADRNPLERTNFKHSKHWGDEMLYFNAPEVFFTEHGVFPAYPKVDEPPDFDVTQKDAPELLDLIVTEKTAMSTRKAAVKELIRIRTASGVASELIQGIDEGAMGYTYQDTVEALVEIGADAIPSIINVLTDPVRGLSASHNAIWALLRIGVYDERVSEALQSVMNEQSALPGTVNYAQEAQVILQHNSQ